jgi:hypothetical protein
MMVSADGKQTKILSTGELKGVRTDRVILVPGPSWEVECVREMYRLVVEENRTPYYITSQLNQKGVPSACGKWRLMAVNQILTHPKYAGTNVWNRSSSRLGTQRRSTPEPNWVVTPGAFQSIISPDQFHKAQEILAEQKKPYSEEELMTGLHNLLREHGALTCNIVRNSRTVSLDTIARVFGSLRRAFRMAGYDPHPFPNEEDMIKAQMCREELFRHLASTSHGELSILRSDRSGKTLLWMASGTKVSVVVCPAINRRRTVDWFVNHAWINRPSLVLIGRLNRDNTGLMDFWLTDQIRCKWIRGRSEVCLATKLRDLSELQVAVEEWLRKRPQSLPVVSNLTGSPLYEV